MGIKTSTLVNWSLPQLRFILEYLWGCTVNNYSSTIKLMRLLHDAVYRFCQVIVKIRVTQKGR